MPKVKDVTLFKDGQQFVTGSPMDVAKLKAQGWKTEPDKPEPRPAPKAQNTASEAKAPGQTSTK